MTAAEDIARRLFDDLRVLTRRNGMVLQRLQDIEDRIARAEEELTESAAVCNCGEPSCQRGVCE